jgi:hypothetical protein
MLNPVRKCESPHAAGLNVFCVQVLTTERAVAYIPPTRRAPRLGAMARL